MSVETNAKRIIKIMQGDTQVWEDTDTWVQLRLGVGVTGNVLFKNNGDGTGSLCGEVYVPTDDRLMVYPPNGYVFKAIHWKQPLLFQSNGFDNGSENIMYGPESGNTVIKVINGNLFIKGFKSSAGVISFTQGRMCLDPHAANVSDPVPIDIAPA